MLCGTVLQPPPLRNPEIAADVDRLATAIASEQGDPAQREQALIIAESKNSHCCGCAPCGPTYWNRCWRQRAAHEEIGRTRCCLA